MGTNKVCMTIWTPVLM